MHSCTASLTYRQRVCQSMLARAFLVSLLLLFVIISTFATVAAAAAAREGSSIRPLHGPGYEHLDCSACLAVSRALYDRLNGTLHENPSTYLASHRLSRANKLRRRPYRNSELLATEVMDNFCRSYENDERILRMHPKSKVRLYHQLVWKDAGLGIRPSLREDEVYPEGAEELWWGDGVELRRYQIAKIYSPTDQEALHGLAMLAATPTMCAALVEDFEEEIEELVKLVHNLSDVEFGLCGLPLPDASEDAEEVRAAIRPITNVCARTAVLRAAARQDQLRWSQYMRREERRKARLAEKLAAKTKDAEASTSKEEVDGAEVHEEPSPSVAAPDAVAQDAASAEAVVATEEGNGLPTDVDEGDL